MKSGRRTLTLVAGWLLLAVGGAVFFGRQPSTSWNGYSLSELLSAYTRIYQGQLTRPSWQDTQIGVRYIGTNALPYLVRWIAYERPAWKDHLLTFTEHLPPLLRWKYLGNYLSPEWAAFKVKGTVYGFEILGPIATPAVPALEKLAADPGRGESAQRAISTLGQIGPSGVPALLRVAADTRTTNRWDALHEIAFLGSAGGPAADLLRRALDSSDPELRDAARRALERIEEGKSDKPPKSVPWVTLRPNQTFFRDTNAATRWFLQKYQTLEDQEILKRISMVTNPVAR
jgi:hypothetical protein